MVIIVLLLVVAFIGWSYIKAKVRKQESDKGNRRYEEDIKEISCGWCRDVCEEY